MSLVTAVIWIVFVALIALFLYLRFRPVPGMRDLGADQFQSALQNESSRMLIDVREPGEFSGGHLDGAVNVPLSQLTVRMHTIPRDKSLYLYCQSGMRSRQAARMLSAQGYADFVNLRGGIAAWRGPLKK